MAFDEHDDRFGWGFDQGRPPASEAREPASRPQAATVELSGLQSWEQLIGGEAYRGVSAETAMRHGAFYACVRIIAASIAQLPFKTYKQNADGTTTEAPSHPLSKLLRLRPNPRMSSVMFWRMIVANMVSRGNGYAWIERSRSGAVRALWPIPKQRVTPVLSTSALTKGRLIYTITLDDGSQVVADMDDVLHIPGSLEWTGLECKSPLSAYASSVNIGHAANDYAQTFLQNDATPPVVLSSDKKIDAARAEEIRNLWQSLGLDANRGKVRILSEGMKADTLEISPEDAQLLETRKATATDIAMMLGVPPHMIGAVDKVTSWGTGIEQQSIGFVTYTLGSHIVAVEQELEAKLFRSDGHHCEVDQRALVRGDMKARGEAYRASLGGSAGPGWRTPNEVRKLENLAPHPDGDTLQGFTDKTAQAEGTSNDETQPPSEPPVDDGAELESGGD